MVAMSELKERRCSVYDGDSIMSASSERVGGLGVFEAAFS
jgi:hypothetical protein